jgi:hypothetical protein
METGIVTATESKSDKSVISISLPKSEKYRSRLIRILEIYEMNLEYVRRIHPVMEVKCA